MSPYLLQNGSYGSCSCSHYRRCSPQRKGAPPIWGPFNKQLLDSETSNQIAIKLPGEVYEEMYP